jgi:site-specific DNA-methyltransferase (adenine-specific)
MSTRFVSYHASPPQPVRQPDDKAHAHAERGQDRATAESVTIFEQNTAQGGDALALLRSLPDRCARLGFFDPQHRETLDRLAYGNENGRQRGRALLPAMTSDYIDTCAREFTRVLMPSGYLLQWVDTFRLCEAYHLRIADVLKCVDLIAWDNLRPGNGYRSRRRGDYLLVLQKPPIVAKSTWHDHGIPSRWPEKIDRSLHPHVKPIGLIARLIGAITKPGELVVDPAAGSFTVMRAAHELGRDFIGCDIAWGNETIEGSAGRDQPNKHDHAGIPARAGSSPDGIPASK